MPQGTYGFLKGVNEILQVNVVPVGSDVALEELAEPVPHPVLEQEGQHGHGQLEEEDEHDGAAELGTKRERESPPCPSARSALPSLTRITALLVGEPHERHGEKAPSQCVLSSEGSRGAHRHRGCLRSQNPHRAESFLAGFGTTQSGCMHKAVARSTAAPGPSGGGILEGPT